MTGRGRPRLPIGSWGEIRAFKTTTGWEARAYFRAADGKRRLASARASSKGRAVNRLKERLIHRMEETLNGGGGITPDTTIKDLCEAWVQSKDGKIKDQTLYNYHSCLRANVYEPIGDVALRELTTGRLVAFFDHVNPGQRRSVRNVLRQALALAQAHDAISTNYAEAVQLPKTKHEVRALSVEELAELMAGVKAWCAGEIDDKGNSLPTARAPRAAGLVQFVYLLLATGCRPGELMALRWCDIDSEADTPTVRVHATVISKPGVGTVRQPFTKTGRARVLTLPPFAVQALMELHSIYPVWSDQSPVFPPAEGDYRHPEALRAPWRKARAAAGRGDSNRFNWVEFRAMRRTVATLIDQLGSDKEAAAQLGHTGVGVTRRHYIAARASVAPDLTEILQRLAG